MNVGEVSETTLILLAMPLLFIALSSIVIAVWLVYTDYQRAQAQAPIIYSETSQLTKEERKALSVQMLADPEFHKIQVVANFAISVAAILILAGISLLLFLYAQAANSDEFLGWPSYLRNIAVTFMLIWLGFLVRRGSRVAIVAASLLFALNGLVQIITLAGENTASTSIFLCYGLFYLIGGATLLSIYTLSQSKNNVIQVSPEKP